MSSKHLFRYVSEFVGRHNIRRWHTADKMAAIVRGMVGKQLRYEDLIGSPHTRINGQMRRDLPETCSDSAILPRLYVHQCIGAFQE